MKVRAFNAFRLTGINTDSLGNYLVSLGLLSAVSKRWPSIRGCWRGETFVLLSDEIESIDELYEYLLNQWQPTDYQRWWVDSQKADTKAKSSKLIRTERNNQPASEIAVLDAHIISTDRNIFNPVLGKGGSIGQRNYANAFAGAISALGKKALKESTRYDWLSATLNGEAKSPLPKLSGGGSWFVYANKTFNSGRDWSQEGRISPWSFIFATEGAIRLSGGVNRRLSSRGRPYAVFPFITEPAAPSVSGDAGLSDGEFWAPLWEFPATLIEVRSILRRGYARIGNRSANAPHSFAVAVLSAGVDIGVRSFARFEMRTTTAGDYKEAIPKPTIVVRDRNKFSSWLLSELIDSRWVERLPADHRQFVGLRGPVEAAIVRIAESPEDPGLWQALLLRMSDAQTRIDRNQKYRQQCLAVPPLSSQWFRKAWGDTFPSEIEVARAIASVGTVTGRVVQQNVFGVEIGESLSNTWFPKVRPSQAVWNTGDPLQNLLSIIHRRLLPRRTTKDDAEETTPFAGTFPCSASTTGEFIRDELDLEMVVRWIPPLSLIHWAGSDGQNTFPSEGSNLTGDEILHGLLRPLFHSVPIGALLKRSDISDNDRQFPKSALLRKLFHLLRFQQIDEAVALARSFYLSHRLSIVAPPSMEVDSDRIAAALLIPMRTSDVANGLKRWLIPERVIST